MDKFSKSLMRSSRKRRLSLLIIGIISLIGLAALVYFSAPTTIFSLSELSIPVSFPLERFFFLPSMILFFVLLWLSLFGIGSCAFKSKIHGILIGSFVIVYLTFRLNHLTNLFFLLLLFALFVTLELFVSNKKE